MQHFVKFHYANGRLTGAAVFNSLSVSYKFINLFLWSSKETDNPLYATIEIPQESKTSYVPMFRI